MSLSSKAEMEFVKNNVDSTPAIFEIWIGLERDSMTGIKVTIKFYLLLMINLI